MPATQLSNTTPDGIIVNFVANARNLVISEKTLQSTTTRIIDTVGVALGGTAGAGIDSMISLAKSWGGNYQCKIPFLDIDTPATTAAWIMGAAAHSLDFDDTHDQLNYIHSAAPVIGAAIAVADAYGLVSGTDFIIGVSVGQEVACRLSKIANKDLGWHRTSLFGSFGAAAACAVILKLNHEQIANAFGIVLGHASGTRQGVEFGGNTKTLQAGQAAADGLTAALLAKEGFVGPRRALTGNFGLFAMYHDKGYSFDDALDGLGAEWLTDTISLKPYPCIRQAHSAIEATIAARGLIDGQVDNIVSITVHTKSDLYLPGLSTESEPAPIGDKIENKYYVPFLIACALSEGQCGLKEVAEVASTRIAKLSKLIRWKTSIEVDKGWAKVVLHLADSSKISAEISAPYGSPTRPLSIETVRQKFIECAKHAIKPLPTDSINYVLQFLEDLASKSNSVAWLRQVRT